MAATCELLAARQYALAHALAVARTSGKSFWTAFDARRRIAWHLVERAAALGCAVAEHAGLLAGCAGRARGSRLSGKFPITRTPSPSLARTERWSSSLFRSFRSWGVA